MLVDIKELLDRARGSLKIAIVYAGDKNDLDTVINTGINSRDWKSYRLVAENIAKTLEKEGFSDVAVLPEDRHLGTELAKRGVDIVWLNSGGVQGINPMAHAPSLLEMLGVPYVGHNPLAVSLLDNKHVFKSVCSAATLPTARFVVLPPSLSSDDLKNSPKFRAAFGNFSGPFIVKPVSGRASKNVHFVDSSDELKTAIEDVREKTGHLCLIEEFLPGDEFAISIMGPLIRRKGKFHDLPQPFAFSAVQRCFESQERIFTSMDEKPITHDRIRLLDGTQESDIIARLENLAREVFSCFTLSSLVRLDLRMNENGELMILEANPKPDLGEPTENIASITCSGLANQEMSYQDLVISIFAERLSQLATFRKLNPGFQRKLFGNMA